MNHIERLTAAIEAADFDIHVYVDNDSVFGIDIRKAVLTLGDQTLLVNVGHAVFGRIANSKDDRLVFVEGRLGDNFFQAVGQTPARALWAFAQHLASITA